MLDLKHYACKNLTKYNILSLNLSNGFGQRFPVSLHSHRANSDQFPWQQSATFSFICILGDQVQVLLVWFMWNIVKKKHAKNGFHLIRTKSRDNIVFSFFPTLTFDVSALGFLIPGPGWLSQTDAWRGFLMYLPPPPSATSSESAFFGWSVYRACAWGDSGRFVRGFACVEMMSALKYE